MIPTIPFDLVFSVLSGLVLSQSARAIVRAHTGPLLDCPALKVALVFVALVLWPQTLYFYFVYPDWSWMYWIDPQRVPKVVAALLLLAHGGAVLGGFAAGYYLIRGGKFRELLGTIGGVGLILVVLSVLLRRRLLKFGTFDDFRGNGPMYSLMQVKLGYSLVVVGVATAAALVYAGWQLHLAGRRIS